MAKLNISKREKNLLFATIGVLIFYLFWQFLFVPTLDQINKLRGQLDIERSGLMASEAKIKVLESSGQQLKTEQKTQESLKKASALQVLKYISLASTSSNLDLISIRPLAQKSSIGSVVSRVQEQKFNLDCKGSYKSLYYFLKKLYSLPVLVVVDSLRVNRISEKPLILRIVVQITAYF